MKIKLNCPVCDYQEIEGDTCPNCDTDLSVIRMLKELPQVENPLRQLKITKWQLGVALLLLVIGIGLGVIGSFIFLQPQLHTLTVSSSNPVSSDRLKLPVHAPVTAKEPPKPITYTVKSGDRLSAIAQKFCGEGTSWQVMVKANPKLKGRKDYIDVGEVLKIPNCKEGT
ncbi:LysM peptidoglycan-binding domain-containing protein [Nostoc sp. XA010]|uniref:LysM peptidoglycan-binding domain-containing protein n=1 Tax=Nostoc sp. XA010 TaxID=2780407 RepID=UPI001E4BAC4F|nr:LysM domain-containing protein [Nostoc sp. XA010]MCC5660874.1 LysM peptidoglycan-binding domain-containing protein [Nostoc sp. XA010]